MHLDLSFLNKGTQQFVLKRPYYQFVNILSFQNKQSIVKFKKAIKLYKCLVDLLKPVLFKAFHTGAEIELYINHYSADGESIFGEIYFFVQL